MRWIRVIVSILSVVCVRCHQENPELNKEISDDILRKHQIKWKQLLESIAFNTNFSKVLGLIQILNNTHTNAPDIHEAITTNNNTIPSHKEQSNLLNAHYSSISQLPHHPTDRAKDRTHRRMRPLTDPPSPFTPKHDQSSNKQLQIRRFHRTQWHILPTLETSRAGGHWDCNRNLQPQNSSQQHPEHFGKSQSYSHTEAQQGPHRIFFIQGNFFIVQPSQKFSIGLFSTPSQHTSHSHPHNTVSEPYNQPPLS